MKTKYKSIFTLQNILYFSNRAGNSLKPYVFENMTIRNEGLFEATFVG